MEFEIAFHKGVHSIPLICGTQVIVCFRSSCGAVHGGPLTGGVNWEAHNVGGGVIAGHQEGGHVKLLVCEGGRSAAHAHILLRNHYREVTNGSTKNTERQRERTLTLILSLNQL